LSFHSAYIALLGLPNAGKSTLLNAMVQKELCIVSDRPQTTRNQILGIRHEKDHQFLFLDTPGWYTGKLKLDQFFRKQVRLSIKDADLVCFLIDANKKGLKANQEYYKIVSEQERPIFLIINKIDCMKQAELIPYLGEIEKNFPGAKEYIPVSALEQNNTEHLVEVLKSYTPEGPPYFPEEMITDKSPAFLISEFVREALFQELYQEVPFSIAVVVEDLDEYEKSIEARCSIYVETKGQKLILLGSKGELIRKIKGNCNKRVRRYFSKKAKIDLWIKVKKGWRQDSTVLSQIGYKA